MKILDYIFAARPILLIPVWSIYLVSLYYHHQMAGKSFAISDLGILTSLTLLSAAAYYINQIYDCESDRLNNKIGFLQAGILKEKEINKLYISSVVLGLLFLPLYPAFMILLLVQVFLLGYFYSAPPLRLKDRSLGGLFVNAYGIGFIIPFLVMPEISTHNAGLLGWDNPFYFMYTVAGIFILTTIPDIEGDRKIGKKTLGVILPYRINIMLALLMFGLAVYTAFYSEHLILFYLAGTTFVLTFTLVFLKIKSYILFVIKLPILLLTLFAGYHYPIYFIFVVALLIATRIYYKKRFNQNYPKLS